MVGVDREVGIRFGSLPASRCRVTTFSRSGHRSSQGPSPQDTVWFLGFRVPSRLAITCHPRVWLHPCFPGTPSPTVPC